MRYFALVFIIAAAGLFVRCGTYFSNLDTPPPETAVKAVVNDISPADALLKTQAAYSQFVDVRSPEEYAAGHAARAKNIPLTELQANLDRLEKNEPVYVICQSGRRSKEAGDILLKNGFNWVFSVDGGTSAWQTAGLPMERSRSGSPN
jgi:rhodanese-related sulfurtransferase